MAYSEIQEYPRNFLNGLIIRLLLVANKVRLWAVRDY